MGELIKNKGEMKNRDGGLDGHEGEWNQAKNARKYKKNERRIYVGFKIEENDLTCDMDAK